MFVDYRLSITEVVIDKQLSTLIKLSNESRYLVDSWLRCHLCLQASFCVLEKVDNIEILSQNNQIKVVTKCTSNFNNPGYTK